MGRQSLRTRLLAIVLVGISLLTAISLLISDWGLTSVRDRAISDSNVALRRQVESSIQRQVQVQAADTAETLAAIQRIAATMRGYLVETLVSEIPGPPSAWKVLPDGRRYQQSVVTMLLPAGADIAPFLVDAAAGARMEKLIPGMQSALPDVIRTTYIARSGMLWTFPRIDPSRLQFSRAPQSLPIYQLALFENNPQRLITWTGVYLDLSEQEYVVSVVAPVYVQAEFVGALVLDISMERLTDYLGYIATEQAGFGFLVDNDGRLIAAPKEGQQVLLGRRMSPEEQGNILLGEVQPPLQDTIAHMRRRGSIVTTVELNRRSYLIASAYINGIGWSLAVLAPLNKISESTNETALGITEIAGDVQTLVLLASLLGVLVLGGVMTFVLRRQFTRPLADLLVATRAISEGEPRHIPTDGVGEIGQLAASFNAMTDSLQSSRAAIIAANQRLELTVSERTADLELAVARLEESFGAQQSLLRMLREVSTPVIPVIAGVLAMPLIGQLDDERAHNATRVLLERIERERARTVLLDITGVPVVDSQVALALLNTVKASQLLGAEVVLVGVSPEVAQAIVSVGIDLHGLRTAADLRTAVEQILRARR